MRCLIKKKKVITYCTGNSLGLVKREKMKGLEAPMPRLKDLAEDKNISIPPIYSQNFLKPYLNSLAQ